jgi:hypothetical protein
MWVEETKQWWDSLGDRPSVGQVKDSLLEIRKQCTPSEESKSFRILTTLQRMANDRSGIFVRASWGGEGWLWGDVKNDGFLLEVDHTGLTGCMWDSVAQIEFKPHPTDRG